MVMLVVASEVTVTALFQLAPMGLAEVEIL
jgi:hypothetical protein